MNDNQSEFKHPRIECGICGMQISQKHLGRHRMRRHPTCPNIDEMTKNAQTKQPQAETNANGMSAEVREAIANQSRKQFSDGIRFVKVRMSEHELIKLMKRGRIHCSVGKFFMYDS